MQLTKEIEHLKQMLLKMSDVVVSNIEQAVNCYVGVGKEVIINDDIVDQYERLIEEICITILLKERPYAKDLKMVTGILKLVADVERIGDHAEDIMEFATKLNKIPENHSEAISNLTIYVVEMIKNSILAFVREDLTLAEEVIKADDFVDKRYAEIIEDLAHPTNPDGEYIPFAIYQTLVVKYLERIADHSVNVAEWVIYIINGVHKDKKIY